MYMVALTAPMIPYLVYMIKDFHTISGKILYLFASLIYSDMTIVGTRNTAHIVFKLLGSQ